MAIKWDETLSVGVSEIDNQHKELISRTDQLLEACRMGKGKEAVGKMVEFLGDYVALHFQTEEKLQKQSGFPKYLEHKAMHDEYLKNIVGLKQQFELHGATLPFVILVNKTVVDWLITHISKVDKELGQYLRSR